MLSVTGSFQQIMEAYAICIEIAIYEALQHKKTATFSSCREFKLINANYTTLIFCFGIASPVNNGR